MKEPSADLIAAAVGPRGASYYRKKWRRFAAKGIPFVDWNWGAFLFGFFWFAYRKMWLICLVYYLLLFPSLELVARTLDKQSWLIIALVTKFIVVPCVANQIYYLYVRRQALRMLEKGLTKEDVSEVLTDRYQTVFDATRSNPKML